MQDSRAEIFPVSVSELNRTARRLLEQGIARLWVEGEVSNLARPASGHVYFSLKDDTAQLRCAWFSQRQRGPTIHVGNGDQVLAYGQVSIYETRGDYQLIVEQVEAAGEGVLRRRFEALKKKLQAEGLFSDDLKKRLPALPRRIGIVTSPSGAAVRDILTVLRRRFPAIPVVIYPAAVQGDAAAGELVTALARAGRRGECDVLIISRGGGSLEDLWPFNEESVARAIHACPLPIVSAVGHEVDFTIADFVADLRAPTPSGAAELLVPDQADWLRRMQALLKRFAQLGRRYLDDNAQALDWLQRRLLQCNPAAMVSRQSAWLQNLRQVLAGVMRHDVALRREALGQRRMRLLQTSPALRVQQSQNRLTLLEQRLRSAAGGHLTGLGTRLELAARGLHAVSPLATLERGYAIVADSDSGRVLRAATDTSAGSRVTARLAKGIIRATVESVDEAGE